MKNKKTQNCSSVVGHLANIHKVLCSITSSAKVSLCSSGRPQTLSFPLSLSPPPPTLHSKLQPLPFLNFQFHLFSLRGPLCLGFSLETFQQWVEKIICFLSPESTIYYLMSSVFKTVLSYVLNNFLIVSDRKFKCIPQCFTLFGSRNPFSLYF